MALARMVRCLPGGARGCVLAVQSAGGLVEHPAGRRGLGQRRQGSAVAGDPGKNLGNLGGRVRALLGIEAPAHQRPTNARVVWPSACFAQHRWCGRSQGSGDVLAVLGGGLLPLHVHVGAGELEPGDLGLLALPGCRPAGSKAELLAFPGGGQQSTAETVGLRSVAEAFLPQPGSRPSSAPCTWSPRRPCRPRSGRPVRRKVVPPSFIRQLPHVRPASAGIRTAGCAGCRSAT